MNRILVAFIVAITLVNVDGATSTAINSNTTTVYRTTSHPAYADSSLTHIQDFVRAVSYRCPACYVNHILSSTSASDACMALEGYKGCLDGTCFTERYSDDIKDAASICDRFYSSNYSGMSGASWNKVHWITSLVLLMTTVVFYSW